MTGGARHRFKPAWWIPGAHAQTVWSKFLRRRWNAPTRDERVETPDGDFLDLVHDDLDPAAPRVLLLHGLEGTRRSHYVTGIFQRARELGWNASLLLFRGCGPQMNRARRLYHSGETTDLAFVVDRLVSASPGNDLFMVGISLGGNVLLKWLGESGEAAPAQVKGAAAISVPFDLERGSRRLQSGFSRVYDRHFLRSLRAKARSKLAQHPGLFDPAALERAASIYDFDDAVTAPVHGFKDARDYYSRSSSIRFLPRIRVPTLLISAVDDPFLPPQVLDEVEAIAAENPNLHVHFLERGGHVGFVGGRFPWQPDYYAERHAMAFLSTVAWREVGTE